MVEGRIVEDNTFKPVTISLTFKCKEELDLFGTIFNYLHICNYFDDDSYWCQNITDVVENAGGNVHMTNDLSKHLKESWKRFESWERYE